MADKKSLAELLKVVPSAKFVALASKSKKPVMREWNKQNTYNPFTKYLISWIGEEITDKDLSEKIFSSYKVKWDPKDGNVGLLTGNPSGIDVIDLDTKDAIDRFEAMERFHGAILPIMSVKTRRGRHIYVAHTKSIPELPTGADWKSTGGQVVVPGSVVGVKNQEHLYEIITSGGLGFINPNWPRFLLPGPPSGLQFLSQPGDLPLAEDNPILMDTDSLTELVLSYWIRGQRNFLTLWLAGAMKHAGHSMDVAWAFIFNIINLAKDEQPKERYLAVKGTFERDEFVKGVAGLIEVMGIEHGEQARRFIGGTRRDYQTYAPELISDDVRAYWKQICNESQYKVMCAIASQFNPETLCSMASNQWLAKEVSLSYAYIKEIISDLMKKELVYRVRRSLGFKWDDETGGAHLTNGTSITYFANVFTPDDIAERYETLKNIASNGNVKVISKDIFSRANLLGIEKETIIKLRNGYLWGDRQIKLFLELLYVVVQIKKEKTKPVTNVASFAKHAAGDPSKFLAWSMKLIRYHAGLARRLILKENSYVADKQEIEATKDCEDPECVSVVNVIMHRRSAAKWPFLPKSQIALEAMTRLRDKRFIALARYWQVKERVTANLYSIQKRLNDWITQSKDWCKIRSLCWFGLDVGAEIAVIGDDMWFISNGHVDIIKKPIAWDHGEIRIKFCPDGSFRLIRLDDTSLPQPTWLKLIKKKHKLPKSRVA